MISNRFDQHSISIPPPNKYHCLSEVGMRKTTAAETDDVQRNFVMTVYQSLTVPYETNFITDLRSSFVNIYWIVVFGIHFFLNNENHLPYENRTVAHLDWFEHWCGTFWLKGILYGTANHFCPDLSNPMFISAHFSSFHRCFIAISELFLINNFQKIKFTI